MTLPEKDLGNLADVRAYAIRALAHVDGITREQFTADEKSVDAVIRCLAVIGEAAGRLSDAAEAALPQFDWRGMTGMRHVLVHDYGRIDLHKVWDVVQGELPRLREELRTFLEKAP